MSDLGNTIVVVYPPAVDAYGFLSRLVGKHVDEEESVIPWTIDNKYYTASVHFLPLELGPEGVVPPCEVLLYLVDSLPSILHPALVKALVDEPKDIALAVRVKSPGDNDPQERKTQDEEGEDVFDQVGLDFVDELASPDDDDERPMDPLEVVRQSLMTHLWSGMVRKEGPSRVILPSTDIPQVGLDNDDNDEEEEEAAAASTFPVGFDTSAPRAPQESGDGDAGSGFPGLAELRAQIEMDDFDRYEGGEFSRLDMLDSFGLGPGEEEYARLDEWLDDEGDSGFVVLDGDGQEGQVGSQSSSQGDGQGDQHPSQDQEESPANGHRDAPETFDDDFDDFAAFQTAPSAPSASRPSAQSLDPTPLLLHLQSVRAELSALPEKERRARAGQEVARVMRDLGFDDVDVDDL